MDKKYLNHKTIAEKILSAHSGKEVRSQELALCTVDFAFGQDGTSSIIIDRVKELCLPKLKTEFCMVIDHSAPSPNEGVSRVHQKMRRFSGEFKTALFDIGCGVCHQVIPESGKILPGDLVLGADSHTCTYGALGIFSTGVGSTDLAVALATGKNWFKVPETIKIEVSGRLQKGVYAKDVILNIIGLLGANGATYKSIEFCGPVISAMDMDGRLTMCNMVVEMGAKCGFMPHDKKTTDWLLARGVKKNKIKPVYADKKAQYSQVIKINVSRLKPQVSVPHSVDTVKDAGNLGGIRIQEAFLGTCTNGRLTDLRTCAKILKKHKVCAEVKFIIAPASRDIMIQAVKEGLIDVFVRKGAVVVAPGCGPCVGTHNGVPADAENVISSANRNFKGRMGNPKAFIYLASPATVTASAIEGRITDPRKYL